MIFLTYLALATSAFTLVTGQFSIRYHNSLACNHISLGCNRYAAYQCCAAPPSRQSFPAVRVTSGGEFAIVIFTETDAAGGCGLCKSTGVLGVCYKNSPFETVFAATVSQCQPHSRKLARDLEKLDVVEQHKECNETVPWNIAGIDGEDYELTDDNRDLIVEDMMGLNVTEFAAKWKSAHQGPTPLEE